MAHRNLLVVLDNDGTIIRLPHAGNSTWWRLDQAVLTPEATAATEFNRRHFLALKSSGRMTDEDERVWLDLSMHALVESKMRLEDIPRVFHKNDGHLRPGFAGFLAWLKAPRENVTVRVAINSYGIVEIISHILAVEGVHDFIDDIIAMRLRFCERGLLTGYDPDTLVVTNIKGRRTAELIEKHGIDAWVGIGDSDGDAQIVPPGSQGRKLLLAHDAAQVQRYGRHFDDAVISDDWSGPREWLARHWGL